MTESEAGEVSPGADEGVVHLGGEAGTALCGGDGKVAAALLSFGDAWCSACWDVLAGRRQPLEGEERPVVITVKNVFKRASGGEICLTDRMDEVDVKPFLGPVAHVTRKYGVSINLGNYENARVEVSVTLPCYLRDVRRADAWAQRFIEKKLREEVTTIRGEQEPKSGEGRF